MKQGTGHSSAGDRKIEPRSQAINPGAAASLGIQEIRTRPEPLVSGRGYEAPQPVATSVHPTGSQGKHK